MRPLILLAALGCSPAGAQSDSRDDFALRHVGLSVADLEMGKHVRDAERFERAGMLDEAEREYWFAELKSLGVAERFSLARLARNRRLTLRDRRRALAEVEGTSVICRFGVPQEQVELVRHIRDGERAAAEGRIGDADREFASAERKILALSEAPKAMTDLLPPVRAARRRLHECRSP